MDPAKDRSESLLVRVMICTDLRETGPIYLP